MKKIYFLLMFLGFTYANELQSPSRIEDLPDYTSPISLVSAYSGNLLFIDEKQLNWNIKEVILTEDIIKRDPFARFGLGAVQFVKPDNASVCLGIDESGFFKGKSCTEDLKSKKLETVFTIIPTITGAVQIRSFVQNANECISVFDNPTLPHGRDFGIAPCGVDSFFNIKLRNLMLILPPKIPAIPSKIP
ncbi:MAG: toxin [Helicobacter sp.]|nr:toxin [Helicobacter sp.]